MALKLSTKKTNTDSKVDWEYVNSQLEEGSHDARIAAVVELGEHDQGLQASDNGVTVVGSREEAIAIIEAVEDVVGQPQVAKNGWDYIEELDNPIYIMPFKIVKDTWVFPLSDKAPDNVMYADSEEEAEDLIKQARGLDKYKNLSKDISYEVIEKPFRLSFNTFDGGEANEFAPIVDLTDLKISYVEGGDLVNYRVHLCPSFEGKLRGFPHKEKYSINSTVSKLCKATGNKHILEDTNKISDLAGSAYFQVLEENGKGGFKTIKDFGTPRPKDEVAELDIEGYPNGMVITWEKATVEQLEALHLGYMYINRIKSAKNYEGSQMQKAIEEYEASRNQGETKDKEEDDAKVEEAQEAKKPAKVKAQKAKPEEVVEEEDGDDSPF